MTTAELAHTISEAMQSLAWAGLTCDDAASNGRSNGDEDARWQSVIDGLLKEWGKRQRLRDEDGIDWPAPAVVETARKLAASLQKHRFGAPTRVVPNGEGGLVFEYQHERELQTMEIEADGTVELCRFHDAKLINRSRIPAASIG